jgi:hypothetical protein
MKHFKDNESSNKQSGGGFEHGFNLWLLVIYPPR